jgi:hypothetical protein
MFQLRGFKKLSNRRTRALDSNYWHPANLVSAYFVRRSPRLQNSDVKLQRMRVLRAWTRRSQNVGMGLGVILGLAFGKAMSLIPSPHSGHVFWLGNLCAPWLVIAFLAGESQRDPLRAATAGLLAEIACVVGFYAQFLFHGRSSLGLSDSTPFFHYALIDLRQWFVFVAFWLVIAVTSGVLYGLLGFWWRRSAPPVAALAVGLPFIAEPGLWALRDHELRGPSYIWVAEVALGVGLIIFLLVRKSRLIVNE